MAKLQKGLSYILGNVDDSQNHILAVNAIQYSHCSNTLFTAGRDGIVKSWIPSYKVNATNTNTHSSPDAKKASSSSPLYENGEKMDIAQLEDELEKLETQIQSKGLQSPETLHNNFHIFDHYNLHTDWINDFKLINNDSHFVTCSSDLSIKVTDVETHQSKKFTSEHTDYIKKLSYNNHDNLIISGGLDRKIVVWDLKTLKPLNKYTNTDEIGSVYSLANNPKANMIVSGGPDNLVNIYDNRSQTKIKSLIGHQDNIRALLVNDDYILSGSSDSTIKLWDLKTFKLLRNFDIHDYSVWTLYSKDLNFNHFLSGDKNGTIIKTDLSYYDHGVDDLLNTDDVPFSNENLGVSVIVAQEDSGIIDLCEGDNSIWCSNSTSFNRYKTPQLSDLSKYQFMKNVNLVKNGITNYNNDLQDLVSQLSIETDNIDVQSANYQHEIGNSSPLSNFNNTTNLDSAFSYNEGIDSGESDLFESMFVSSDGGPSTEFINNTPIDNQSDLIFKNGLDLSTIEILFEHIPPNLIFLKPFNTTACETQSIGSSIVVKRLLNNKRHVLAMSSDGVIELWDMIICKSIKRIKDKNSEGKLNEKDFKFFEDTVKQYQTNEVLSNWCTVEIKSGKLLISITRNNYLNCEVYSDELSGDYIDIATNFPDLESDSRHFLGLILLKSIFNRYVQDEFNFDKELRQKIKENKKNGKKSYKLFDNGNDSSVSKIITNGSNSKGDENKEKGFRGRFFNRKSSKSVVQTTVQADPKSTTESEANSSITTTTTTNSSNSDNNMIKDNEIVDVDSIAAHLQETKKKYEEKGTSSLSDSLLRASEPEFKIPIVSLPENLQIIINESSSDLGNSRDLYRFSISDINSSGANKLSINEIRKNVPRWIGAAILFDEYKPRDVQKIGFVLEEFNYDTIPERIYKKLPAANNNNNRLNANSMLRVKKILIYITDRLASRTTEMSDGLQPEQWLEVLVNGEVMSYTATLTTIKNKIWKSNTDIVFQYRRKNYV